MYTTRTGYEGQKYVVSCDSGGIKNFQLGWTNEEDGGVFKGFVDKHPAMSNLVVQECNKTGKPMENGNGESEELSVRGEDTT